MANVDLVDLIPILKAIRNIKREYKQAIQTEYDDFSLYPVLTENFLDTCYNNGYVVGFRQAWKDYLGSEEVEVTIPREMRELTPATFSDSGDADYDTLTSIMSFCLSIRQELKTILDLDTDLFELYPPEVVSKGNEEFANGVNDGYAAAINDIDNFTPAAPTFIIINNTAKIQTPYPEADIFYKTNADMPWQPYIRGNVILITEDISKLYAYVRCGTKPSAVAMQDVNYVDFYSPVITFDDTTNKAMIDSFYPTDSEVKTKYRLSTWESFIDFLDYDGMAIPVSQPLTIYAYNYLGEQISETVSLDCIPNVTPVTKPATPVISFTSETNVLSITCSTPGASIYYQKEGSNLGYIPYTGSIILSESGTYTAIALLNGVESDESDPVTCNVSSNSGTGVPTSPTVYAPKVIPNNNTVIVTTTQTGVTLYIRNTRDGNYTDSANNIPSYFVLYTGPFSISMTNTYEAKAVLSSDTSKYAFSVPTLCTYYEASGSGSGGDSTYVAPPVINCVGSVVSMTALTTGSTIYYREKTETDDGEWLVYSEPFTIYENTIFEAYASKDGNNSTTTVQACEGSSVPFSCNISCSNNMVYITSHSEGATIYFKKKTEGDDTWQTYSGPFRIFETTTYQAYAIKNGEESEITTHICTYVEDNIANKYLTIYNPLLNPISGLDNTSSIRWSINSMVSNIGLYSRWGTVYYKIDDSDWTRYTGGGTVYIYPGQKMQFYRALYPFDKNDKIYKIPGSIDSNGLSFYANSAYQLGILYGNFNISSFLEDSSTYFTEEFLSEIVDDVIYPRWTDEVYSSYSPSDYLDLDIPTVEATLERIGDTTNATLTCSSTHSYDVRFQYTSNNGSTVSIMYSNTTTVAWNKTYKVRAVLVHTSGSSYVYDWIGQWYDVTVI